MATVTKTWSFASGVEGFVATTASGATGSWDGTIGNPAGSLKMRRQGRNLSGAQSYWEWTGTWEDLGVPVGGIVTSVRLTSGWTRVSEYATAASSTVGPYQLRDASGATLIGTLWAGRTATGTDAGTAIAAQSAVAVGEHTSDTTITIRLADTLATGNNASAAISAHDDQVTLEVTYAVPLAQAAADAEGLSDLADTALGYGRNQDDDAGVTDTAEFFKDEASGQWVWDFSTRIG